MQEEIVIFGDDKSVYNIGLMNELSKHGIFSSCCNIRTEVNRLCEERHISNSLVKLLVLPFFVSKVFRKFSKETKKTRIAHIQYVSFKYALLLPFLENRFKKVILSFWGSDLLRQSNLKLLLLKKLFVKSSRISFETEEMRNIFIKRLSYAEKWSKIQYARFGLSVLSDIDTVTKDDLLAFKIRYGIDVQKRIVTLGYNRIKEQQHIPVIESLDSELILKDIQLVIPWAYGAAEDGYEEKVIKALEEKGVSYVILRDFLSGKDLACLRMTGDVFIQVQTTDSFSASMLESLYAKKTVITGSWLPYTFFDERGIKMYEVDTPGQVGMLLPSVLNNLETDQKQNRENAEKIGSFATWNACINDWIQLYEE